MTDILTKFRGFCHTLRHDGIDLTEQWTHFLPNVNQLLSLKKSIFYAHSAPKSPGKGAQ
jgi:hypothetical protein